MRTLRYVSLEKQKIIAQETLDIFAPLAHRLGIWRIKFEMEDLAFRHLYPDEYYNLVNAIARKRKGRRRSAGRDGDHRKKLAELNIKCDIQGRPKHFIVSTKRCSAEQVAGRNL